MHYSQDCICVRPEAGRAGVFDCDGAMQRSGPLWQRWVALDTDLGAAYTRPQMGTWQHAAQPSTTASRAAADLAAPVLTAAPLMRVAHSRHASVRTTDDRVAANATGGTLAGVAGTSIPRLSDSAVD